MSVVEPGTVRSESLIDRVKAILLSPGAAWDRIDAEPATISGLYTGYVGILVGISVVAGLIGSLVFGYGAFGFVYRPSIISAVVNAIVSYALALAMVFVLALVIDALAPSFDGQKSQIQAFKVAAYSGTAGWVTGIVGIVPQLAPLAILGSLYGLYLLYLGLPKLMKVPQAKALGYTVVTIIVAVVLFIVIGAVTAMVRGPAMFGGAGLGHFGAASGSVAVPGGNVDLAKLSAAAQAVQANIQTQSAGQPAAGSSAAGTAVTAKAIAPDVLKGLLPASLSAGYARTEVSSQGGAVGGVSGSSAQGVYTKGDGRITLEVSDSAGVGALLGMAGALNIESSKQTATGYEKVGKVDGRLTTEEFDQQAKTGKYSVVVASRFVVEADGAGVTMDDLKAAVSSIGMGQLEGLAKGA